MKPVILLILGAILGPWLSGLPGIILAALGLSVVGIVFARPRVKAKTWARAVTFVIAMGLLLSLGDLALRPILADTLYFRPHEALIERRGGRADLFHYRPQAHFERKIIGDLAAMTGRRDWAEPRHVSFSTDRHGFRNPLDLEPPFDLLLLGDSFFLGDGSSQDDILSSELRRRGNRVYNLGVGGFSPWEEMMTLLMEWPRLKSDSAPIIIWGIFSGNDLDELEDGYRGIFDPERRDHALVGIWHRLQSFRKRSPVRQLLQRIRRGERDSKPSPVIAMPRIDHGRDDAPTLFFRPYGISSTRGETEIRAHRHWPAMLACLDAMKEFAEANSLPVLIVGIPSKEEIHAISAQDGHLERPDTTHTSGFLSTVAAEATRRGFGFLDLTTPFRQETVRRRREGLTPLHWRDDTHWSPAGHRLAADLILTALPQMESRHEER